MTREGDATMARAEGEGDWRNSKRQRGCLCVAVSCACICLCVTKRGRRKYAKSEKRELIGRVTIERGMLHESFVNSHRIHSHNDINDSKGTKERKRRKEGVVCWWATGRQEWAGCDCRRGREGMRGKHRRKGPRLGLGLDWAAGVLVC